MSSAATGGGLGSSLPAIIMANGGKQPKLEPKSGAGASAGGAPGAKGSANVAPDKHESWQMELLMERLRSKAKSSQYKSFQEMSKAVRMSLLEKRYALDAVEKSNLQKTLDSMQYCIKVTSRQGLVERLDCLTRQLGLKLSEDTSGLFISSDMFYLEIILDPNGTVQDVKVHHECKMKQQSCSELVSCLQRGDFVDFTTQLEGLASIYQLNAEKKIKVNAFVALQALETDLYNLYSLSTQLFTDIHSLLLKSPLGVVQKRRGGHAMKLTYYIAPYDLLDLEAKKMKPLNADLISTEKIGYSVAVNLEASTANKLQIQPLLVHQGNSPVYSPIEKHNSTSLPATFVLRLNKPMALNTAMLKQIKAITGDNSTSEPISNAGQSCLISLIVQHASNGAVSNIAKGLFVTLPDQYHCYYMTENKNLQGTIISSIPFTEPQHVSKVLVFLRQQALFNQLLSSCIRNNGSSNTRISDYYEHLLVFEVAALSCQYITVSLEHPFEESLAMVEFDLRNMLAIQVRVFCNGYETDARISKRVSLIVQRTMSIPVTLRGLMKIWQEEYEGKFKGKVLSGAANGGSGNGVAMDEGGNFSLSMGPDEGGGNGSAGPGGGGSVMNGTHNGSLNGGGMGVVHQEFCDVKKVKLEPLDASMKRSRSGEDFCRSPKSKVESEGANEEMEDEDDDDYDESTNMSSGDSNNSLGGNQQMNVGQLLSVASSSLSAVAAAMGAPAPPISMGPTAGNAGSDSSGNSSTILGNLDFSSLDPDLMRSSNSSDLDDTVGDIGDSDGKPSSEDKPPSYASSVSITPIGVGKPSSSSMTNSVLSNIGLDKRPGIEIIPLATATANVPSSITITPIPMGSSGGSSKSSSSSSSDKKLSSSSSSNLSRKSGSSSSESDRAKLEKKKKRRHEEQLAQLQQMGPPHKILSKSSDGPASPSTAGASSSSSSRKFSVSPVPMKSGSGSSGSSSSSNQLFLSSSSGSPGGTGSKSSPKHSPVHHSSPKHQGSYGTSSPKHISGGSSGGGKPSMSALKSAASSGSPSSKSSSSSGGGGKEDSGSSKSGSGGSVSSRDRDRDRDRDKSDKKSGYSSSSNSSSPKLKTPAVKLKQLDLANCGAALSAGVQLELMNSNSSGGSSAGSGASIDFSDSALFGAGAADLSRNPSAAAAASAAGMLLLQQAMKNRKGSLSAVIDKLKSAQSGDESPFMLLPELAQQAGFTLKADAPTKTASSSSSPSSAPSSSATTPVSNLTGPAVVGSSAAASAAVTAAFAAHLSSVMQGKSSEYMVKPSSDGMKLTIQNKKSSKSGSSSGSSSKSSSSGSSSKSGIKPSVSSSGPMPSSKKLPSSHSFSGGGGLPIGSSSGKSSTSSSSSKSSFQKSSSSGSLSSSSSGAVRSSSKSSSSSSGGSSSSKDKSRSSSKSSTAAAAASSLNAAAMVVAAQAAAAAHVQANVNALNVMKMLGLTSSLQSMEGYAKSLDTKFQIPKLSARPGSSGGTDIDKLKHESRPTSSSAPTTPLPNVAQSPTGVNDFSLPFNKLPGDVSPLHSAMLPNVMQKMFSAHDSSMLLRRSPNLDHQSSSNSRDGFSTLYGKGSTTPTTPTGGSVPPPFPSPVQSHAMDYSNSSDSADASLMRPPSRPSSTMSNHSSSDKLIEATTNSNSMDGLRSTSPAQAFAAAAQFMNKLDNTQQLVAALKSHHHHLNALNAAAAVAAAAAAASATGGGSGGIGGPGPVTSPTSVSVHIVKSPVPSPLPLHSGSSGPAPDEDETLVGGVSGK